MTAANNLPEHSSKTNIDTPKSDRAIYRRGRQAKEVDRLNDINGMLTERNEKLQEENQQLRAALNDTNMFQKASEIKSKDVLISADKFGQLFVTLRNNMSNGTEAIVCQLNDDCTKVVSVIPKQKVHPA